MSERDSSDSIGSDLSVDIISRKTDGYNRDPETPNDQVREGLELSVVIPCLNEADTIADCVDKARQAIIDQGINGEVIVADNGSSDDSNTIATRAGARVIPVEARGYGNALMGGIAAARGRFVIMGDADGSYDFTEIPSFVDKLREGYDLVQGCRLPSGGGHIMPKAMRPLHRWFGNPVFSSIAGRWFNSPIHDVYCGMRGFTKQHFERLGQKCGGMEFATEMIIKSCTLGARIAEVPITLYPDRRETHRSHLRTFRDGWRTLRLFLLSCPRWLFVIPGVALIVMGLIGYAVALPGMKVSGITFDAHTLLFASLAILCGSQSIFFGIFAKALAISQGELPEDPGLTRLLAALKLERGLIAGCIGILIGLVLLIIAIHQWAQVDYGPLDYAHTMRFVVPGAALTSLGFQTFISSFLLSLLTRP